MPAHTTKHYCVGVEVVPKGGGRSAMVGTVKSTGREPVNIHTENLFGGSLGCAQVTQKQTGINKSTLSRIRQGREAFSAAGARKAAEVTGEEAANIYLTTQIRSLKMRLDSDEITATLKGVGRVLATLKEEFPDAEISEEQAKALQDLASEASKGGTSQLERLGRGGADQRVTKRQDTTATKNASRGDRLGRDGGGLKVEKRYGA